MDKIALLNQTNRLLDKGQYFLALDLLLPCINNFKNDVELLQRTARALIQVGAEQRAELLLKILVKNKKNTDESIGLLAKIYKNRWIQSGDIKDARLSRDTYLQGKNSYYTLINAATLSWVINDKQTADTLAKQVIFMCNKALENADKTEHYWLYVTLGEANIITGNHQHAIKYYKNAVKQVNGRDSMIVSSLQQLKLMLHHKFEIPEQIFDLLKPPTVLVFAGQPIDTPYCQTDVFPESYVAEKIERAIDKLKPHVVFTSASCGSDIIFCEKMLNRGAEVNVVLPFQERDYSMTNVAFAGHDWVKRYRQVLERSNVHYATDEGYLGDEILFDYANQITFGLALLRSTTLETTPHLLAVVDKNMVRKPADATYIAEYWPLKNQITKITLDRLKEESRLLSKGRHKRTIKSSLPEKQSEQSTTSNHREIKILLSANLVNYNHLKEQEIPVFFNQIFKQINRRFFRSTSESPFINTLGNNIFAVLNTAIETALFATLLNESILEYNLSSKKKTDVNKDDTDNKIQARIILNSGPVFHMEDLLTGYFGCHVNRTVRLEPAIHHGLVYSTEQFAAKLMSEQEKQKTHEFICNYIGNLSFSRDFAEEPVYCIHRNALVDSK